MLNEQFVKMVNNELSQTIDFCVWGNNITEGIIRSTIEASILFLGYLKSNKRTSSIVFTDNIDGSFLFNIKSTFLNDGNDNTYILSMSFEDISENDEDVYYFIDIPELTNWVKIYAKEKYEIYYSDISSAGIQREQDESQLIFYIIPLIFTCIYNYININPESNGILEVKDCVTFKLVQNEVRVKFSPHTKQLFKSDKYIEMINAQ